MANPQQEIDEFSAWMNSGGVAPATEADEFGAWMASGGKTEQLAQNSKLAPSGQPTQAQPNEVRQPAMVDDPLGNGPAVGGIEQIFADGMSRGTPIFVEGSDEEKRYTAQQRARRAANHKPMTYLESLGNPLDTATAMLSGANNMLYMGFDDEIAEGLAKLGAAPLEGYRANQDQMRAEQPGAFMGGGMVAGFAPFGIANAIAKPQGVLQTATMGGGVGAVQGGAYGFGDTDGALDQRIQGGQDGAKFGAALGAAFGGGLAAAPKIVGAARSRGDGRSQLGDLLEGMIEPGTLSSDGIKVLDRFLAKNQIRLDNDTLGRINQLRNQFIESGSDPTTLPVRLKDILIESLDGKGGYLAQAIEKQLQGTMARGGDGAKTIFNAIDEDLPAARKAIKARFDSVLGSKSRFGQEKRIDEALSQISAEGYRPLFAKGIQSEEGAEALQKFLAEPGIGSANKKLREAAILGLGRDLDDFIEKQPLEAVHWIQSTAGELAQAATDAGDTVAARNLGLFRDRALKAINKAAPGYDDVRKMYGDELSNREAHGFAKRFIAKVSGEEGPYQIDLLKEQFNGFSPAEQEAALISLRDMLKATAGKGWAEKAPQLTRLLHENVQEAFGEVFGKEGAEIIRSVNSTKRFVDSRTKPDTRNNSQTTPNREAIETALLNVQPNWRRKVGGALQNFASDSAMSSAFGGFAPLRTLPNALGSIGKGISGDPSKGLNALAELLEAPVQPRGQGSSLPPESGPPTPTPRNALADAPNLNTVTEAQGNRANLSQRLSSARFEYAHADGQKITVKGTENTLNVKSKYGEILADKKGGAIKIRASQIREGQQDRGLGKEMYESLAKAANELGVPLMSDRAVTPQAASVWRSLKRKGYNVVDNYAEPDKLDGGFGKASDGQSPFILLPDNMTYEQALDLALPQRASRNDLAALMAQR